MRNWWRLAALLGIIAVWQASYLFGISHWIPLGISLILLLVFGKGNYRPDRTSLTSLYLGALLVALLIVPGIAASTLKLSMTHFSISGLTYSLLFSCVVAITISRFSIEPVKRKPYVFFPLSIVTYALLITPVQYFTETAGLPSLLMYRLFPIAMLSIYLSFLYLKSNGNTITVWVFLAVYSAISALGLYMTVDKMMILVWQLVSIGVIFILTDILIPDNFLTRRMFRTKRKFKITKDKHDTAVLVVSAVLILMMLMIPLGAHTPDPILADPTPSMEPSITPGSLLIVNHVSADSLKVGQIVVFHAPWDGGTMYAHQIISISSTNGTVFLQTKGTNNAVADQSLVPEADVVGVVAYHLPYLGYLLIYKSLTVSISLFILALLFVRSMRR